MRLLTNATSTTTGSTRVMLGTGMTLERSDFADILATDRRRSVPAGVLCQFCLMPLAATVVGRTLLLSYPDAAIGKHLFLGLTLVGCSPGGTASNLVSLIAGADVALSVLLTACSTVLAAAVTPLLVRWIAGSAAPVSGLALCLATSRVVLAPVAMGVAMNECVPGVCRAVSRFAPFASVVLVSLICGGVVANNAAVIVGAASGSVAAVTLASVLILHMLGFAAGYLVPKKLLKFDERTSRTMSIETGMQNSALAVVLAKSIGADPLACLPGAFSATAHSCLGSGLAAFWRWRDAKKSTSSKG
jgi:BASS family bile acid:Na+ symporter